jgi:hypothetical protein
MNAILHRLGFRHKSPARHQFGGCAADLVLYLGYSIRDFQILTDTRRLELHLVYIPSGLLIARRRWQDDFWEIL